MLQTLKLKNKNLQNEEIKFLKDWLQVAGNQKYEKKKHYQNFLTSSPEAYPEHPWSYRRSLRWWMKEIRLQSVSPLSDRWQLGTARTRLDRWASVQSRQKRGRGRSSSHRVGSCEYDQTWIPGTWLSQGRRGHWQIPVIDFTMYFCEYKIIAHLWSFSSVKFIF